MYYTNLGMVLVVTLGMLVLHPVGLTSAYVVDGEASSQNTVSGGILDGKLSEVGAATQGSTLDELLEDTLNETWKDTSHESILSLSAAVNNTVRVNNTASSLPADRVNVTVSYTESDGSLGGSGNADKTAQTLTIESFKYQNTELVGTKIVDENGDGSVDIYDLTIGETATNISQLSGVSAGGTADLHLSINGDAGLLSGVGGDDGVNIQVTIQAENASFEDADVSQDNVIRYATL